MLWMILFGGILLRLIPYLFNRSLWLDESMLALNIINKNFTQLITQPLEYNQAAPLLFLVVEKVSANTFGPTEYALRLFPFLCGVLSLFLFYRLSKLCLTPKAVPIALGLFAIAGPVIYYSSEVKQYSSDVAVALLLSWAAIYCVSHEVSAREYIAFGLLGFASIWLSHPAVFVLTGIAVSLPLFSFSLVKEQWQARIPRLAMINSAWAVSFATCYFVSLRHAANNRTLLFEWKTTFIPSPLLSVHAAKWFVSTFFDIFRSPVGLELTGLAALSFLVGCVSMFSTKRKELFILMFPVLVTLLAAGAHKYPFNGRVLLFIVPALLLLIAQGAEQIRVLTAGRSTFVGACFLVLLFFHPLFFSTYGLIKPNLDSLPLGVDAATVPAGVGHTREEMKPVMNYISEHRRQGDVLYVYDAATPAFLYYAPKYHLDKMNYVLGRAASGTENWNDYENDIDQLRGNGRVWFLVSHLHQQEKFLVYLLDHRGTRLDVFRSLGAQVHLYDLEHVSSSK
jgi:hypothetical protein